VVTPVSAGATSEMMQEAVVALGVPHSGRVNIIND